MELTLRAAHALNQLLQNETAFTALVAAFEDLTLDPQTALDDAEGLHAMCAQRAGEPAAVGPALYTRRVQSLGRIRIERNVYASPLLAAYEGAAVLVALAHDVDHPGRRIAIVRDVETGEIVGPAYMLDDVGFMGPVPTVRFALDDETDLRLAA